MGTWIDKDYKSWIIDVKSKIRTAQMKAMLAVNSVVIESYWDLGKMITEKQTAWGTKFIEQASKDLREVFSEMKGLFTRNLKYCRSFYVFYKNAIGQQPVDQLNTIGIVLCRDKNNIEVEFALRDMGNPIGVSEFSFTKILPEELKSSLPTIEKLE